MPIVKHSLCSFQQSSHFLLGSWTITQTISLKNSLVIPVWPVLQHCPFHLQSSSSLGPGQADQRHTGFCQPSLLGCKVVKQAICLAESDSVLSFMLTCYNQKVDCLVFSCSFLWFCKQVQLCG